MDPPVTTDKEGYATKTNESSPDDSTKKSEDVPVIKINPSNDDIEFTVTPATPSFTISDEGIFEPTSNALAVEDNVPRPSQQSIALLDELKYLLRPTNSLARVEAPVQASQEADPSIKRRTMHFDDDPFYDHERLLIEGLTVNEAKSLDAAERRSIASRGRRSSNSSRTSSTRSRAHTMQPLTDPRLSIQPTSPDLVHSRPRTILDHLSGLIWAFLAAYAFSIILFLTKVFHIDFIFAFFLQMVVQSIAFGVYAFYKGYNLLGPSENRIAMVCRGILIGIGMLTTFLAYYYITLPELSAIRQTQIILTIILSLFFLHERVTISRIIACILTLIAIVVLIRPTTIGRGSSEELFNLTKDETIWVPYSSPWNLIIGFGFALCTAITYSIASIMGQVYSNTQSLHNTVLCFWSALSGLIISIILVYITHFSIKDARSFPHDWRLFIGIGLGLASIFVFIANQKAIKRERHSIVKSIYATDIILALLLQNLFTPIKSDLVIILGCLLILGSIIIICIDIFLIENRQKTFADKLAQVVNITGENDNKFQQLSTNKGEQQRSSI